MYVCIHRLIHIIATKYIPVRYTPVPPAPPSTPAIFPQIHCTRQGGMNGSTKSGSSWSRLHARINRVADHLFYRLGYWVATHAQRTLLISLVLVTLCCLGFANFTIEEDGASFFSESTGSSTCPHSNDCSTLSKALTEKESKSVGQKRHNPAPPCMDAVHEELVLRLPPSVHSFSPLVMRVR